MIVVSFFRTRFFKVGLLGQLLKYKGPQSLRHDLKVLGVFNGFFIRNLVWVGYNFFNFSKKALLKKCKGNPDIQ